MPFGDVGLLTLTAGDLVRNLVRVDFSMRSKASLRQTLERENCKDKLPERVCESDERQIHVDCVIREV